MPRATGATSANTSSAIRDKRTTWLVVVGLFAAVIALHLWSLTRTPAVFVDEGNYASEAWGLVQTGWAFGPVQSGVLNHFPGYWTYFPWLGTFFQSLGIRALGLSLFSLRLVSLVFGLLLLVAIFVIAERLRGVRTACFAVALVALSSSFFESAHLARQDIFVAAFGYGSVALYLVDRDSRFSVRAVLSGLAIGLAFEIHPNATIYGPALVAFYLVDHGWATFRLKRFWGFVAGGLAGGCFWAAMHLLPYPQTFIAITRLQFGVSKAPPALVLDPGIWLRSLDDTIWVIVSAGDYVAAVVVAVAIVILARRGSPADRRLVLLFAVLALGFLTLVSYKPVYYNILLSPAEDLVVAAFLGRLLELPTAAFRRVMLPLTVVLLAGSAAFNVSAARDNALADYQQTIRQIRPVLPAGSVVMGDQTFWIGLHDYKFYTWQELTTYQRYTGDTSLADGFRAYHPDFFIVDGYVRFHISDDRGKYEPWAQLLNLPKTDLETFLTRRARVVKQVDDPQLGPVVVYKLDWSSR